MTPGSLHRLLILLIDEITLFLTTDGAFRQ